MPAEIELLEQLVAIRSVSGSEQAIAEFVEGTVRRWGLAVERDETSVRVEVRERAEGPTLALVSHLDTVPPGSGWTRDPFVPVTEGTRLYGRGSIGLGHGGIRGGPDWTMKREMLSPRYTTHWDELPVVKAA